MSLGFSVIVPDRFGFNKYRPTGREIYPLGAQVWQSSYVQDVMAQVASWMTVPDVAEALNIPLGKARRLIEEHSLVAVRREGVMMVPSELIVNGEPLPSLRGTILVLLDAGFTLGKAIEWLYTEEPMLSTTPIKALLAGRKAEIRRLAQALAL